MRYLKWILLLIVIIFIFLQVLNNMETFGTTLAFSLRIPGENPTIHINFLSLAIIIFASGFLIAILIEIYYWFKYSRTIRQQNKTIQSLRKELETLKPATHPEPLPYEAQAEETKTLPPSQSPD
jgi:ABC-type Na+ efflux pump permease subunit